MAEPVILNAAGVTQLVLKNGVTAKVGDLIGHDGTDFVLADADARIPAQFLAMHMLAGDGSAKLAVCTAGVLFDSDGPYTAGADQYLLTTAGAHGATIPAASSTLTELQKVGKAVATDTMAFDLNVRGPRHLRATAAVDPANLASDAIGNTAVTVTGVKANDLVLAIPPATLEARITPQSCIATDDTVTIRMQNETAGAVNGASLTWTFHAQRY